MLLLLVLLADELLYWPATCCMFPELTAQPCFPKNEISVLNWCWATDIYQRLSNLPTRHYYGNLILLNSWRCQICLCLWISEFVHVIVHFINIWNGCLGTHLLDLPKLNSIQFKFSPVLVVLCQITTYITLATICNKFSSRGDSPAWRTAVQE